MTRRFKVLGAAFVAVLAMSALVASAAQATEFFHSHVEKTIVTGTGIGVQEFTLPNDAGASIVKCKGAKVEGTEVGVKNVGGTLGTTWTTETSTVHPTYSECTLGANAMVVRTNKCHFKLFAETTSTEGSLGPMGNLEINECPEAAPIEWEVAALGIIIEVKNQTINHCLRYDNNKTGTTNEWDFKVVVTCGTEVGTTKTTGLAWKCKKGGAACEAAFGVKAGNELAYKGEFTVKGFEDLCGATPCETGKYAEKEGAQTGIWKGPAE